MSKTEIDQVAVFEQLKVKTMKQKRAAELLNLSLRQIKRKLKDYRKSGATSLAHAGRGKPGNRKFNPLVMKQALSLIQTNYADFGPTFATEKLKANYGITISHETLRLAMIKGEIWIPKVRKQPTVHAWRERRLCRGELVQLDGSPHAWFEERAPKCTLLAFVDDATSETLWLEFCNGESTMNLLRATDH